MRYPFPKNTYIVPLFLLLSIWLVFLLQQIDVIPQNECFGIVPRSIEGLRGIFLAPLFHGGWNHILNNSYALVVLSFFAVLTYQRLAYFVIFFGWISTGILVWLFADFPLWNDYVGCHIGASGLVYVLASFVFFSGIFRKSNQLIAVSLVVVLLYGGFIWGIFPTDWLPKNPFSDGTPISWESHLFGAISGFIMSILFRKNGPQRKVYDWESEDYYDPKAEALWQAYLDAVELSEIEKNSQETIENSEQNLPTLDNINPSELPKNSTGIHYIFKSSDK